MKVAAIVPACNEEHRIGRVLAIIRSAGVADDVVVVSDGSSDRTAEVAAGIDGVRVFSLAENVGKGGAMRFGVEQTDADVLLFLDADLIGIQPSHVRQLVEPVLNDSADMSIGVFCGGRKITDLSQRLVPYISGQRALRRAAFLDVPDVQHSRAGIEIAMTCYAKNNRLKVKHVSLPGVTHPTKEEKLGLLKGIAARVVMYWEIVSYVGRQRVNHKSRVLLEKIRGNGDAREGDSIPSKATGD